MKKFLLIDDHFVVRSGMKGLLSGIYINCEIHEAENAGETLEKLKTNEYDMILMDVQIPNNDMIGLMEFIHVKYPQAKVLIFSMTTENIYARRFLKAGAKGFLSKEGSQEEIIKAINLVLNDRKYISDSLGQMLAEETFSGKSVNPFEQLTSREFEITSLLLSGNSQTDIAKSLNLEPSTIGTHKTRIFNKLNVSNLMELKELEASYKLK
jgi:two-component system invasion response regulator UvrY